MFDHHMSKVLKCEQSQLTFEVVLYNLCKFALLSYSQRNL